VQPLTHTFKQINFWLEAAIQDVQAQGTGPGSTDFSQVRGFGE